MCFSLICHRQSITYRLDSTHKTDRVLCRTSCPLERIESIRYGDKNRSTDQSVARLRRTLTRYNTQVSCGKQAFSLPSLYGSVSSSAPLPPPPAFYSFIFSSASSLPLLIRMCCVPSRIMLVRTLGKFRQTVFRISMDRFRLLCYTNSRMCVAHTSFYFNCTFYYILGSVYIC